MCGNPRERQAWVKIGKPHEVYRCPRNTFVARFIGSPAMKMMKASWSFGTAGSSLFQGGRVRAARFDAPPNPMPRG
jgi:ABC-type sugar transport system ATPase subunit